MAGWISSKLKVAENLLQQIDQQAADSLGKADKPRRSPSASDLASVTAKHNQPQPGADYSTSATKFPLLKKSTPDLAKVSVLQSPSSFSASAKPTPDPTVIDWTELLSSPSPNVPATVPRVADGSAVQRPSLLSVVKKPAVSKNGKSSSRRAATPSSSSSSSSSSLVFPSSKEHRDGENQLRQVELQKSLLSGGEPLLISEAGRLEIVTDWNRSKEEGAKVKAVSQFINVSTRRSSESGRDSDTESSSGSDSEEETRRAEERRKRREHILAEKAARAATDAIKEKEDIVARLEGEKESLEKILEERERQQAKEASELQMSMIETMEAVDLEKQKHNSTRMEALARLAELEAQNAVLAKSLATEQWNLEVALNRVAELKQQIGFKELTQEELKRRMSTVKKQASSPCIMEPLRKDRVDREILDAEYSFTCDKIARLKDKAQWLEESIGKTKREILQPTEVELELKKRLSQLTDHLIQKQTQVESLSSEKSTLVFRMEKLSRMLDENGIPLEDGEFESLDIETGRWQHSGYATKAALRERIRSGRQQLGLVIRQLDAIFSAGAIFVRRNTMAQFFSFFYLLCLHLWVLYILMSHSQVSDGASQGSSFS
ncbi:golgin candidate 2 [Dendrobium catenatum]|uniref:Golgin candidate 2 n=1 Tax=Dendrobium catenatum TaxID=906689 RepID=A0A2I0XEC5_9ASPA|nr:golgin candidate 2 [Dendrobium catenatum]PKU86268.1 Golgin candidate 2 [Dendrobium catenatum]